ncbi:Glycosyltransferase involved in cell wall bisynthesis [Pseudozobellia thermophila]|uniref:Glycosyltransferase involved in cell wall bisynthesis n=1 Tax=Pseudozobellia thermophila TaxID=192903 RepID=A0A1M6IUS9_9FLAO|nr:Glycosyltransferase involved in cell wall bisynthesis [Pseudozobellia thermophila]
MFLITGLGTGGAEMMLFKFLTRLDCTTFSPYVVSLIPGGVFENRIKDLGIPVFSLDMVQGVPNPFVLFRLKKYLDIIKPNIIQGWMYHANFIALFGKLLWDKKVPVLWSIHHSINSLKNEKISLALLIKLTALLSKKPDKVIFSAKTGKFQHLQIGYKSVNSLAINDNFDLTLFREESNRLRGLRNSWSISEDAILIGSLARFHPMKDHLGLLSAAAKVIGKYPNVYFVLAGPNVDYNNYELTSFIKKHGIADKIHLLGEIHYVPKFFNSIDIYVSSSAYGESFPNVIGEAMACGVSCVVTDVGDSKFIVGSTGIVVPPRDTEALMLAFKKLIELGPMKLVKMGEKAKSRISSEFDLDAPNSFVRKYEKLYMQAVEVPNK